ncbi:MAG: tetratricopeptide repeat protein [Aureispira sp.]
MAPKKHSKGSKKTNKTKKKAPAPTPTASSSKLPTQFWGAALILVLLTAFVYRGALNNEFVDWDDYKYVINNDLVRSSIDIESSTVLKGSGRILKQTTSPHQTNIGDIFSRSVALNYHPLTMLTLRWNNNADPASFEGISARPFILWNIILHVLNTILVLLLIYCLSKKNIWISVFVATTFALHPAHVESVVWVSERKDVLYSFFFLLGLLSYWKYLETTAKKWFWRAFGLFVMACLSKAMAVVFPLVLLLLHFWKHEEEPLNAFKAILSSKTWLPLWPFFATALFFGIMAINIQAGGDFYGLIAPSTTTGALADMDTFTIGERLQFAGYGFVQYLVHFFWPVDLSPYYPYPDRESFEGVLFKIAPLLMLLVLIGSVFSLKKTKAVAMGIGFYFFTIVLVLQFISVGGVVMADRYTYLAYIGVAMALAFLVQQYIAPAQQTTVLAGLTFLALLGSVQTIQQIEVWQNSETLWTTAIAQQTKDGHPLLANMVQPLNIRGGYYGKRAQASQSLAEQQKYLQQSFEDFNLAAQLGSNDVNVYKGLGNSYGMAGNSKQAQARQLQQQGNTAQSQRLLQQAQQDFQKAIGYYTKVMQINPQESVEAYFNRGVTYSIIRDHAKAIADYTVFIQNNPQQVSDAYLNRGLSYYELQQYPAAKADFEMVLRMNPQNQLAHQYLRKIFSK